MATKKKIDLNEETDEVPNKLANRIENSDQKKAHEDIGSNRNNNQYRGIRSQINAQNLPQAENFRNQDHKRNTKKDGNEEQNWRQNRNELNNDQFRNKNKNTGDGIKSTLKSTEQDSHQMRNSNRNYQTQNNFNKSENITFHSKDNSAKNNQDNWRRNQNRNQSESENQTFRSKDNSAKNNQDNWRCNQNRNQSESENQRNNKNRSNYYNNYNKNDQNTSYSSQKSSIFSQTENTASTDVNRFWNNLSRRVLNQKFELHIDEHALWLETWKAAACGAIGPIKILPIAYLRLPAVTDISPTPIVIVNVLIQVINSIRLNQATRNDFSTVNILEAVLDVITLRLINIVNGNFLSNTDDLLKAVNDLDNKLRLEITKSMQTNPNDIERVARLILRQSTEINELRKKIKENSSNQQGMDMQIENLEKPAWLGWQQNPTLDWLMSGSWHIVEGLKASYESSEDYAESLLKLWTLLTFYWGSGAVWPRCSHKQGDASSSDMVCGEPLLTATNSGFCKKSGCNGNAAWKCFRQNHDHICKRCLLRQQDALVGSPGPQASTDIYDAVIEREVIRREETVYLLKNVESRKPPKIAPNWKTSYRLPISVLVAVIKLSVSREPISRKSSIQWGEIVAYDIKSGANQDWTHRSRGCMAIRLLNKANCVGMPDETDAFFDLGVRVAIIDLRVFVPEVISVLNTFSKNDFKNQLDQIPFFERLIGHGSTQKPLELNLNNSINDIISYALVNSEIDYIQRLDPYAKSELIQDICALKPIRSLSGTQLEAFAAALYSSVHCTQGPPGTGKSYIGVCLVLALDLIRRNAESRGQAVGPILVLSYKNHALDEFLIDVLEQHKACSNHSLQPGMLIRTGNPDIESLERYTEKHSPLERFAKDNLENIIFIQRNARNVIKELLECARSLETGLDIDWISHLEMLRINNFNSSNVVCLALTMYLIISEYEQNHDAKDELTKKKLTDLNDEEMKTIFKNGAIKILEKLKLKSFTFDLDNLSDKILNFIISLSKDLEHWKIPKNMSSIYFYINSWLKGKNPPPRCQAFILNDLLCTEEADKSSQYCRLLHNCRSTLSCNNQRIKPEIQFCLEHSCQIPECKFERFKDTKYCSKHICSACILTNSKEIKCRNPLACNDHKCTINNCNKLQIYPYYGFCFDHVCSECAMTSKTDKHFKRLDGNKICEIHKCRVNSCKNKRLNSTIEFCVYHVCRVCNQNNVLIGADLVCPQSQLCEKHRCSNSNQCSNSKADQSLNCVNHSCKECLVLKCSIIYPAVEEIPRNSCKNHPLCQFVNNKGKLCNTIAKKPTFYCIKHQELKKESRDTIKDDKKCSGLTTRNVPCKSVQTGLVHNKWYCKQHQDQATPEVIYTEISDEDSSDEEEIKADNNKITNLLPVLKAETYIDFLKKIVCNGKFNNEERCDVTIFEKNDLPNWFCPIHEYLNKKFKTKEINIESKIEEIKIKIEESLKKEKINMVEDIPTVKSELKSVEEEIQVNKNNETIIEEIIDFDEALATNINPDEMEIYYDDDEEQQQNEELKRLQELTEIADYSDEEEKEEEIIKQTETLSINNNQNIQTEIENHLFEVQNWTWKLSHQDRLIAAAKLIRLVCNIFKRLNKIISENDLYAARKNFSEAGAQSFRSARIVGSTVVGASRRLEALRSAGPFAVVIEEACEVIEPTLMSVLAVNTLRKLEMIGDHRQLPAFVQQCWFNFETTIPSIKTSLFERLISGTVKSYNKKNNAAAILPHTVLDEQRRMRSSIADITRPDYNDLVQILDHKHTKVQCIGDVVIRSCVDKDQIKNTKTHRHTWISKGRSVPGLHENIYFWDLLNNSESRPIAGLSACNQGEAEAVASLTKWLLLCGCPPASISIITPYKGQKNAITLALRKLNCLPPFRRDKPPPRGTTLTISTVDRYQGDENDIVILSLVRCSPGNRFVGLQNRFVVAMSRARLGFFVIGSVKAVVTNRNGSEGPSHWRRFISHLKPKEENEDKLEINSRCGNQLPICCPRHGRKVMLNVSKVTEFPDEKSWNKFCSLPCLTVLDRCGHLCNLPCHCPVKIPHNNKCNESLERPCETHALIPLFCHEVEIQKAESLENALNRFDCKIIVDYCRPECGHVVNVECFNKKKLENGREILEDCGEIVSDYIHPICNHYFKKPKCAVKRKYELKAPNCTEKVLHKRPCGCETKMQCYESNEESINPSICNSSVEIARPRCGHKLSMRCFEAEKLKEDWIKQIGKSAINNQSVRVIHGENYGPSESSINQKIPQCLVQVDYVAPCGHLTKTPCSFAFEYASGLKKSPDCTSQIEFLCPICRCSVKNECWLSQSLNSFKIWKDEGVLNKIKSNEVCISEACFNEAIIPELTARIDKYLPKLCSSKITILRICSPKHIASIDCYQLLELLMHKKSLKSCNSPIDRILPCNHTVSVDCSKKNQNPPPVCDTKVDDVYTYSCGIHQIKPNKCSKLTQLLTNNPKCTQQITCFRYRCTHKITIPCYLKQTVEAASPGNILIAGQTTISSNIEYCDAGIGIQACKELVNYFYEHCGHLKKDVECVDAFSWAANNEIQPQCIQKIEFNNPVCGHQNKALCYEKDLMRLWNPWINELEKPKLLEYVLKHDENNEPIIAYSMDEKVLKLNPAPKRVSKETLICQIPFSLNRKCGHTLLTTCSTVYWQSYLQCQEPVWIECDKADCKFKRFLSCSSNEIEKRTGKISACKNKVSRMCKKCMINKVDIECSQLVIECNSPASFTLPCKHEVNWICGTEEDPRENPSNCQSCILIKWEGIIKSDITSENNQKLFKQIETNIDKFLADFAKIKNNHIVILPDDFESHDKCRREIMNRYITNARNKFINISKPNTETLADLSFYELVFFKATKYTDFPINSDKFYFEQTNTEYGRGCELFQLSLTGLKSCKPDNEGLIHIIVGAAYRFNILPHTPPYRINKNGDKAANKLVFNQKKDGFDGIQSSSEKSEAKRFVFWEPGSCIQLKLLSLKMTEMCKICFDYYTEEKGFSCSKKHFLCWDCFEQNVNQASGPGSVGKCVDNEGNILCPECSEPITLLNVAKESVPKNVFVLLENLKSNIKIKKAVDEALKDQETRLKKEFERIQAIKDKEEQMAERLRLEIIEDILTLRCPQCKCAFFDYSGCADLTCGKCDVHFCALCLKDCGKDAHAHVANCIDNPNPGNVFITEEQFKKQHSKRRENLIKDKLKDQSEKTKNIICQRMEKDFRDLGIQIKYQPEATNVPNPKTNSFFNIFRR